MPAIVNAANEVVVQAFLDGQLNFLDIPRVIEAVMTTMPAAALGSLDDVLAADAEARRRAHEQLPAPYPAAVRAAV
jgi:1-deoxy-D-xylulose-5-phosphate reductoisomerase